MSRMLKAIDIVMSYLKRQNSPTT